MGGDTAPTIEFAGDGNLTSKVEPGKITYSLNNKITIGGEKNKKVTVDGTTGTITGLTNTKWDKDHVTEGRAATEGQLNDVQTSVQNEIKELSDKAVTYKDKEKSEIALAGKDGTKITNLKDGDISKDSKDAVNGGQLFAAKNDLRLKEGTISYDKKGNGVMTLTQGDGETANKVEVKGLQNTYTESGAYDEKAKALVFNRNDGGNYKVDLSRFVRGIDFSLNKLDRKINGVGAGAAALAALQPLDFDPDAKWDFSAGYGQYKGAIAAAVGAYYRPNEDTLFSMGGTFGAGENMFNAGVSVKLGQGNHVTTSRVAMAKDMLAMQQRMAQMEEQMAKMQELITALTGGTPQAHDMFPDVPKNHWAYEYIRSLAKRGILEGYENGKFDGDRTMSRYEFAAMLYRAMEKGVDLDKRAVAEFAPELDRVRVDVITRHKNGDPDIERVRVNK